MSAPPRNPEPESPNPEPPCELECVLPATSAGLRLDVALAQSLPQLSRSYAARLLKDGAILVDGRPAKPSHKVRGGERVAVELPEPEEIEARPEDIPLEILFEDRDIVVVAKPAGMVTHPSSGHASGALVNALLFHCKDLSTINGKLRPGIVHRLDKDTSGVIVAAKNDAAHRALAEQFAARQVRKEYVALCHGQPLRNEFSCSGRIVRHRTRRTEMTVARSPDEGREAYTEFTVLERFPGEVFYVRALPRTGRTHQIRVHLAKSGFPVLADALYGQERGLPEYGLFRQALHAQRLSFTHPTTGAPASFEAPMPGDMAGALEKLRESGSRKR
ncbi:MAG: RluA family pseudouridine synthase [Planctomycetota bacterium]|nr:RluA family pseudouridine synthase [Planctomycetota bacterium]